MKHVLAAYVFVLHPGPSNTSYETNDELTSNGVRLASVVAWQESPSFTMVSYRRQNDKSHRGRVATSPVSEEKAHAFKIEDDQSQPSKFRPPLPPQDHVCQRNYAVRQNDGPSQRSETRIGNGLSDELIVDSVTVREAESRQLQDKPQPDSTYPARQSQHLCCPVCKGTIMDSAVHRTETLDLLQPLLLLQVFIKAAPISTFTFCIRDLDYSIQQQWLLKMPPVNRKRPCSAGMQEAAERLVKHVASTFSLGRFVIGGKQQNRTDETNQTRGQMVLRSCANLLVSALSSERFQEIISLIVSTAMTERKNHSSRVSCDDLYQLVAEVFDELERLLVQQGDDGYTSMFGFVDDILSLIYSDTTYNMLRSTASKILLHKQDSIKVMIQDFYQVFESYAHECSEISRVDDVDAQPRAESWMETSRPTNWYDIAGQTCRLGPSSLMNTTRTWSENWCRRWFLDPTSLSIHPSYSPVNAADARLHDSNPSLLSVLAFIPILASVDLTIEGSRLSVEAVMSESTPDLHTTSGTVLELDGQTRTFEKLPSGLPAAAASVLFGDSWNFDAYTGYVSDDGGSLEILLTTPSQSQANQRFERPNKYYAGTELTLLARTVRVHLSLNDEIDSHRDCCLVIHAEFFQAQLEKNATTGRLARVELVESARDQCYLHRFATKLFSHIGTDCCCPMVWRWYCRTMT